MALSRLRRLPKFTVHTIQHIATNLFSPYQLHRTRAVLHDSCFSETRLIVCLKSRASHVIYCLQSNHVWRFWYTYQAWSPPCSTPSSRRLGTDSTMSVCIFDRSSRSASRTTFSILSRSWTTSWRRSASIPDFSISKSIFVAAALTAELNKSMPRRFLPLAVKRLSPPRAFIGDLLATLELSTTFLH